MEVKLENQEAWAFTYKKLGSKKVLPADYAGVLTLLNTYGYVKHVREELDSAGKCHIHGIVLLRRGFHRKRLIVNGFHCCLRSIYDEKDWVRYCNKDDDKPDVPYLFDPIYEINN